jgi:hypothetical protein
MSTGIEREEKMSMRVQHKNDYYPSRDALGLYAGRSGAPGLLERPSRLVIARHDVPKQSLFPIILSLEGRGLR